MNANQAPGPTDAGDASAWASRRDLSPRVTSGLNFALPDDDRDAVFAFIRELAELAVATGDLRIDSPVNAA